MDNLKNSLTFILQQNWKQLLNTSNRRRKKFSEENEVTKTFKSCLETIVEKIDF